jgi:hypothetical protein
MLVSLVIVAPVWATIITVEVTGVVDGVGTHGGLALDGSVVIGSTMTGFYTYDTDTPDLVPQFDHRGEYQLISISMTVGNYTFTHNPTSPDPALFEVSTFGHSYTAHSLEPRFDGTLYIDGLPRTYGEVNFDSFGLTLMHLVDFNNDITDELPSSFPDLSTFTSERYFGTGVDSPSVEPGFDISGELTSLNVVPEPATVLLLAFGGLALLRNRKIKGTERRFCASC